MPRQPQNRRSDQNRNTRPPRIAFVFQGGGSLSAPQIGMLRALLEAGIRPDLVVGSSAGALNAVAFASDPSLAGVHRLEHLWLRLRRRHVAAVELRTVARAVRRRSDGLVSAAPLGELLATLVAPCIEETAVPAHVVATELETGRPVILSAGETVPALLASAAFPGIYAPVEIGGMRLIDGGVSADIPVRQAELLGAEVTYVLPAAVSADTEVPLRGPLAMAYRALGQILDAASRRDVAAARGSVHVLPAVTSAASNPLDFRGTQRLIAHGYAAAVSWLAADTELAVAT
jgi:NTE family protein